MGRLAVASWVSPTYMPTGKSGFPGLPALSRSHFLGHKPLSKSAGSFFIGVFLILKLTDVFLTLPELKINLTFLKLHFEGNESIMCTQAHASWGKTVRKEVGTCLAPSLPWEWSLYIYISRAGRERWGLAGHRKWKSSFQGAGEFP